MKKLFCFLFYLLAGIGLISAQTTRVTGTVISSEDNEPVIGASVVVKGAVGTGTITNVDGEFTLNVPTNATTLIVSYIGMVTQEVTIRPTMRIIMDSDAQSLDEVVVTAMGMRRSAKAVVAAVQEVKGDALAQTRGPSLLNNLAGKVAGVQITSSSGALGSSSRIQIRGLNTIGQDNQPLFVVDGTPIITNSNTVGNVDLGSGASGVDAENIASMSVLKGASATALYGSRGMNGVVLITTKQGSLGRKDLSVRVSSGLSFEQISTLPKYQNEYGQGDYGSEFAWKEYGEGMSYQDYARTTYAYVDGNGRGINDTTDESWGARLDAGLLMDQFHGKNQPWVSHPNNIRNMFQTGTTFTNNLTISGANDDVAARISYTNDMMRGTTPTTYIHSNNINANAVIKFNRFLDADLNVTYVNRKGNLPTQGYESGNPIQMAGWFGRQVDTKLLKDNWEKYDEYGLPYNWISMYHNNPWFTFNTRKSSINDNRVFGNFSLNFTFTDYLKLKLRAGTDYNNQDNTRTFHSMDADYRGDNGAFRTLRRERIESNLDALLLFNKSFADISVSATFGGNWRDYKYLLVETNADRLVVPDFYAISNVDGTPVVQYRREHLRQNSIFGSANIGYKNWLFLDVSGRNDWSSTLPSTAWSYFYPSIGVSAIFTDALNLDSDILSFGKIRASWAQVGNATEPYKLLAIWTSSTAINGYPQFDYARTLPTPYLKPQRKTDIELGADLRFLRNRFSVDFTWYKNRTTDQIIDIPLTGATGYTRMTINSGEVQNKGVELILSARILESRNGLNWTSTINWSKFKNKVVDIFGVEGEDGYIGAYRIGAMWSVTKRATKGGTAEDLYARSILKNEDGVPLIGANGMYRNGGEQLVGNTMPDWLGGWNNEFTYKNFNFSFMLNSKWGGDMFAVTTWFGTYAGVLAETTKNGIRENGVIAEGIYAPGTTIDGVDVSGQPNRTPVEAQDYFSQYYTYPDRVIFKSTYIKLSEMVFGYTFIPKANPYVKQVNVSFVGRNLALLYIHKSNFGGIDPEVSSLSTNVDQMGFEQYAYPATRSLGFKLSLTF